MLTIMILYSTYILLSMVSILIVTKGSQPVYVTYKKLKED
ncbi:hypothetical protein LCGC14_0815430 [marine sediment metagenome]|uniref:Uncharacterized protein n=1 Tax=marine sediment metagenome TaxID=412755 RepID=A0A0F9SSZ0_9ZZZZ